MRKQITFILVFLGTLFMQSCSSIKVENDWTKDKLKGKVRSVTEISYKAKEQDGKIVKGEREREYDWDNDFQKKYDKNGNKIEKKWHYSDGRLSSSQAYKYSEIGNMIESNKHYSGSLSRTVYKYDDLGNMIEENSYGSGGDMNSKITYKHDESGNLIAWKRYYSDGSLNQTETRKHDESGNLLEQNKYKPDGSLDYSATYKYDEVGNIVEWKFYRTDGTINGKIIYKHDYKGNKVEENHYNYNLDEPKKGPKYIHQYTYDKEGNWTERIDFKNGTLTYILEREIEYYD